MKQIQPPPNTQTTLLRTCHMFFSKYLGGSSMSKAWAHTLKWIPNENPWLPVIETKWSPVRNFETLFRDIRIKRNHEWSENCTEAEDIYMIIPHNFNLGQTSFINLVNVSNLRQIKLFKQLQPEALIYALSASKATKLFSVLCTEFKKDLLHCVKVYNNVVQGWRRE